MVPNGMSDAVLGPLVSQTPNVSRTRKTAIANIPKITVTDNLLALLLFKLLGTNVTKSAKINITIKTKELPSASLPNATTAADAGRA